MEGQDNIPSLDFPWLDFDPENNDDCWAMISELVNFCESASPLSAGHSSELDLFLATEMDNNISTQAGDKGINNGDEDTNNLTFTMLMPVMPEGTNNVEDDTTKSPQPSLVPEDIEGEATIVVEESKEQPICTGSQMEMAAHQPAFATIVLEPPPLLPEHQLQLASPTTCGHPNLLTITPSTAALPDVAFGTNKRGRVKRPMNAYMIWSRIHRPILSQANPHVRPRDVSVLLGDEWSKLTNAQQQPYFDEAERLKRKHAEEYPNWEYRPDIKRRKISYHP